jgi:GNAT superfamily N-acetyltransferase
VTLSWLDREHLDNRDVSGAVTVLEASRAVDSPHWLPMTTSRFTAGVVHGWDRDPAHTAVLRDGAQVVGVLQVTFPSWDNRHLGWLEVNVDPRARRRGFGRALYDAGVARTRAEGRTLVVADSFDTTGCVAFAKEMGLDRVSDEVQRQQDLAGLDWARLAREEEVATARSADYELVELIGATPDDLLDSVVELATAINDAPTDDLDLEDEAFSPDRIRAFDETQVAFGRRTYRVMARHRATGAPAGHTVVAVEHELPWEGQQYDTSVVRAHRGHRLGLRLKIAMLRWLQTQEPQLRTLSTWNAASNDHMIEVNEALGYEVAARAIAWQLHL